jgi:hypothetical protein
MGTIIPLGCASLPFKRRRIAAFVIATLAGILLLLTGLQGPVFLYQAIENLLPKLTQNQQILQIANVIAAVFISIALAGGLAVIAGGIIVLFNHVTVGKFVIAVGTGVGIVWLILLMVTLLTTLQISTIFERYTPFGWAGLILAFIARIVAK